MKTLNHLALAPLLLLLSPLALRAQLQSGSIQGTITDPSGAVIPFATVVLRDTQGAAQSIPTGSQGNFHFDQLSPGRYSLTISAEGFAPYTAQNVLVAAGRVTPQSPSLKLLTAQQSVGVQAPGLSVDTAADNNASAIVITGKALDALSDDPDELQSELNALAGPAAGPSGGQIYIDGFTGGQLPPKSSIREIRINHNPFAAQYDKLGYGRIEIFTKPGTDKFHAMIMVNGNDSSFNSRNPFVSGEPPYFSTFFNGNASGSLSRSASWFANAFRRDDRGNSIVNAELLDANGNPYNYTAAVASPQSRIDISPRIDLQIGSSNTLSLRYLFDQQKQTNSGVSQFALQSQAYNVANQEQTLQVSDTQAFSKTINELRFQYVRDRSNQVAQQSGPTVSVQGAFTGGGNNQAVVRDKQDRYELQDYVTTALGRHALNIGARFRLTRESAYSTSGFNGNYIYPSLTAYAANTPSEYDVTAGEPGAKVSLFDASLFFQDDYNFRPNLTVSYGLRYEAQNRISDHADWAPRLSFAYSPGAKRGTPARTTIRGGYGWFFDRFSATYVLDAIRQNGVNQLQYVVKQPSFYQNAPSATQLASSAIVAPTTYQVAPHFKAAVNMQSAIAVEHQFGRVATASATYINSRGVHQYLTSNINAYLPGTYNALTSTGVRPNGVNENIYQFGSEGVYNQNQLVVNYQVKAKMVSLFGFYLWNRAKADTSGPTYFPSNSFNAGSDYGRANFDVSNRFLLGGNLQGPFGISLSPMLVADSGQPFNITVGQDLNGDNQFNDRPAFATAQSTNTMQTKYGNFDLSPSASQTRIPYNLGNGPSQLSMNLRLSRSFGIGPKVDTGSGDPAGMGPPGGGPPGGPPGGGGGAPGGGLGPGGLGKNGGPPGLDQAAARRYSLNVAVMGRNIFNNVNLAQPVGVLGSSLFGKSTALSQGFFSSSSANRTIDLQMRLSF